MAGWEKNAIIYHIYPLGFCGAPMLNADTAAAQRIEKVLDWVPHLKEMHVNCVLFGPVFESSTHGYDTNDYQLIDRRLGDNKSFKKVCDTLHSEGIRVMLDGVFNHCGRDFGPFEDLQKNLRQSEYADWFHNVNFDQTSRLGDAFSYEGWQGHFNLVKLNLRNPAVTSYLLDSVKMWIDEFGIDGLRLDAADCVDPEFFKQLRRTVKEKRADFWLMGEIIHGDYRRWANPEMLDSVTNYECHKGLYSSHNEKNYFEIGYSLNRQFGNGGIYKGLDLFTFVDNHDVNRIASMMKNPRHLFNVYTMMYTMPGVPSIYYGSEWGIAGVRNQTSDTALRPCLELGQIPNPNEDLLKHIEALGAVRLELPALQEGDYEQVEVRNEQLVFKRSCPGQTVYCVFNLAEEEASLSFPCAGTNLTDKLHFDTSYPVQNGRVNVTVPSCSAMILTEGKGVQEAPKFQEQQGVVVGGKYHHFKGGDYVVLAVGRHSETEEEMVVYQELDRQKNIWIRPLPMFMGEVNDFGNIKPRFAFIANPGN